MSDSPQPPEPATVVLDVVPKDLAQELAATDFGSVLTNPLYSRVVRSALAMLVTFVSAKFFRTDLETAAVMDYVEVFIILVACVSVIWYRWKTTHKIESVTSVADSLWPVLQKAATPRIRADLMQLIKQRNPKVYDVLVQRTL